jgi:transposase
LRDVGDQPNDAFIATARQKLLAAIQQRGALPLTLPAWRPGPSLSRKRARELRANAYSDRLLEGNDIIAVIPPKANRVAPIQYDWAIYKEHHLVECFFGRLKQFRRIATRYDKTAVAFFAFVSLACLMVWLR